MESISKHDIQNRLNAIEREHDIRIVYALESGSRAWGFASKDSDYDIRFIYVHRLQWYLSLKRKRDVIEYPPDKLWDINGWDLSKALRLFRKSNPPLLEWLQSPIVYREWGSLAEQLRQLAGEHFSPKASVYHYLRMASANFEGYLKQKEVKLKKYFYALRPLLACRWIESRQEAAPIRFQKLTDCLPADGPIRRIVSDLLASKIRSSEMGSSPAIAELNRFLANEIAYFNETAGQQKAGPSIEWEILDELFQATLSAAWTD